MIVTFLDVSLHLEAKKKNPTSHILMVLRMKGVLTLDLKSCKCIFNILLKSNKRQNMLKCQVDHSFSKSSSSLSPCLCWLCWLHWANFLAGLSWVEGTRSEFAWLALKRSAWDWQGERGSQLYCFITQAEEVELVMVGCLVTDWWWWWVFPVFIFITTSGRQSEVYRVCGLSLNITENDLNWR